MDTSKIGRKRKVRRESCTAEKIAESKEAERNLDEVNSLSQQAIMEGDSLTSTLRGMRAAAVKAGYGDEFFKPFDGLVGQLQINLGCIRKFFSEKGLKISSTVERDGATKTSGSSAVPTDVSFEITDRPCSTSTATDVGAEDVVEEGEE